MHGCIDKNVDKRINPDTWVLCVYVSYDQRVKTWSTGDLTSHLVAKPLFNNKLASKKNWSEIQKNSEYTNAWWRVYIIFSYLHVKNLVGRFLF
jgi:23S rRNA C2498 (ribose-2'-O)-methylase RlmM